MAHYRVEQRRVVHRGREFHFVSYEGKHADPGRGTAEIVPMWCLMSAGKRFEVMRHVEGQDVTEVDRLLIRWLDSHVFG